MHAVAAGGSTIATRGRARIAALSTMLAVLSMFAVPAGPRATEGGMIRAIVSAVPGAVEEARAVVSRLGGRVLRPLPVIDGFSVELPSGSVGVVARDASVRSVVRDGSLRPMSVLDAAAVSTGDPSSRTSAQSTSGETTAGPEVRKIKVPSGAMSTITRIVGAQDMWARGFAGQGIDVAVIDTGVAPVAGLHDGHVVNGPDLSFDYQVGGPAYLDAFGHGTHMAGIIAGRDEGVGPAPCSGCLNSSGYSDPKKFVGVAPEARIVNLKVGAFDGAADVSQVIAAIDWVVQHRNDPGMNIRVLNLSYGTDGSQDYELDPLAFAVENAWRKGIVVVVAAGNDGTSLRSLANPALNPTILAVGAEDPMETLDWHDDVVPQWASRGTVTRHVDVVAPGVSVASLGVPGSFIWEHHPAGRVSERLMRGSGTSQAAAVVSGVAALLLSAKPDATPDSIKRALMATARPLPSDPSLVRGSGLVDAAKALQAQPNVGTPQPWAPAQGTGSIENARGSIHLEMDGVWLVGEQDIFGNLWDGSSWAAATFGGTAWQGGTWRGQTWSGRAWAGSDWENAQWTGQSWSGQSWSGQSWSGRQWSGQSWSGQSWSGQSWSGQSWSGQSWSGQSWSGRSWASVDW